MGIVCNTSNVVDGKLLEASVLVVALPFGSLMRDVLRTSTPTVPEDKRGTLNVPPSTTVLTS